MFIINLLGLVFIALIIWWFWLYKPRATAPGDKDLLVTVDGGTYSPARITVAADKPVTINFVRRDPSPCAETLVIPDLQISDTLPLNKTKSVQLPAMAAGEYPFHCQMQMYRGTLIVQ